MKHMIQHECVIWYISLIIHMQKTKAPILQIVSIRPLCN